jgi:hypothetical protein
MDIQNVRRKEEHGNWFRDRESPCAQHCLDADTVTDDSSDSEAREGEQQGLAGEEKEKRWRGGLAECSKTTEAESE